MLSRKLILALCLCLFTAGSIEGQWVTNQLKAKHLIVDTYAPYNIITLEIPDNGAFIVWQDKKEGNKAQLYFQSIDNTSRVRFRADGQKVTTLPGEKDEPIAKMAADGTMFLLWKDFSHSPKGELYLQRIQANGQMFFGETGLPVMKLNYPNTKYSLSVDSKFNAYVTLIEKRDTLPQTYTVKLQKIQPSGRTEFPEEGVRVYSCNSLKFSPMTIPMPDSGAFVSWLEIHQGKNNIMLQHIDKAGRIGLLKRNVQISPPSENVLAYDIYNIANDKYAAVWQASGKSKEISYQVFNSKAQPQFMEPVKLGARLKGSKSSFQSFINQDNAVVVTWIQENAQKKFIYTQKIINSGKLAWSDSGKSVTRNSVNVMAYSFCSDRIGNLFVSWLDRNERSKQLNILAQKIDKEGKYCWGPGGYPMLYSGELDKSYLRLINYTPQSMAAIYCEKNKMETAIFGQRLFPEPRGISIFSDFAASVNGDSIVLAWQTQNESVVKTYRIEKLLLRSAKDTTWTEVASVPAKPFQGNNEYRFAYVPDSDGVYFFRVVQQVGSAALSVSENQKVSYLKDFGEKIVVLQNNPNPFSDTTAIYYYLPEQMPVKLEFYNSRIERVDDYYISDTRRGRNKFVFSAGKLPEGIYFYRFTAGDIVEVKKFVVSR